MPAPVSKPAYAQDKALSYLKVPPHSIEAEQAVLGGLMIDNNAWEQVAEILQEQDFYRADHRLLFRAMAELINRDKPLDVITLSETLKERRELEQVGGEVYLFEMAKNTPSAANILAYAEIVRERSILRQLIQVGQTIADSAFQSEGRSSIELLDAAERHVFAIAEQGNKSNGPVHIKKLLANAAEHVQMLSESENGICGTHTGYKDLDELTSGLQASDLIVVAGRPSMGKTTFAMNIAENIALKEAKPVLVFSMEMPGSALALRLLSSLGRISQQNIRNGKLHDQDWARIHSTVNIMSDIPLYVDDSPGLTPAELRARARRLAKEHGQLGLIVIDYLQLMHVPGYFNNRTGEISEISRSLKSLAKELKVPVIAASQLNRSLEQRADKRPVMSDLRESGAIEQDADLIMFIYRDEVYHKDSPDKGTAEIIIAKQRNGPIGHVKLTFLGQYNKFENFAPNFDNPLVSNKTAQYSA
jgi:replicative DNA helicase